MKILGILTLVFMGNAFAKPDCESYSPFNFFPGPKDLTLGFSLKRSEIISTEEWDHKSEPQMKLSEAIGIASNAASSLSLSYSIEFEAIKLQQFGCNAPNHYYYDVTYHTRDNKGRLWGSYHIIVYQNGSVYLPIEVPLPNYGGPSSKHKSPSV